MAEKLMSKGRLSLNFDSNITSMENSDNNSPIEGNGFKPLQLSYNEERILKLNNKMIG